MKTKPLEAVSEAGEGILVLLYTLLLTMLFGLGAGCVAQTTPTTYTKTLPGTRAEVWERIIPVISNTFLVIDTQAKEPGFINLNFSTPDPSKYLDCGQLTFTQPDGKSSALDRSAPQLTWRSKDKNGTWEYKRRITLNGRVNIILQELTNSIWNQTVVKIKSRYQVDIQGRARKTALSHADSEALAFGNPDDITPVGVVILYHSPDRIRIRPRGFPSGFATGETTTVAVRPVQRPTHTDPLSSDSFSDPRRYLEALRAYIETPTVRLAVADPQTIEVILRSLTMQCTPTGQLERDLLALLN